MRKDFFVIAVRNIRNRLLRSFLTTLGIVIGVAALISLLLVGLGLDHTIQEQFEKIGTNRIYVVMKGGGLMSLTEGLTEEDAEVLERVQGFSYVTPYYMENTRVTFNKEDLSLMVVGYPSEDADERFEGHDLTLEGGRYFKAGEKGVAIIGSRLAHDLYDQDILVHHQLKVNGKRLKVVGIFDPIGNAQDDSTLYVPLEEARELFGKTDEISVIEILLKPGINMDQTVKSAERALERYRGDDDFDIMTPDQILGQLEDVTFIVNVVLLAIAGISLIVGSLGIMNSMYTAVLERRKEIGIMKSIGATNTMIRFLFLIESGIIGLIGSFLGVLVGVTIAKLIQFFATASGLFALNIPLNPWILGMGLLFGLVVGMISGYLPAKQASLLQPVDALQKV